MQSESTNHTLITSDFNPGTGDILDKTIIPWFIAGLWKMSRSADLLANSLGQTKKIEQTHLNVNKNKG
jgi:hypothetical protein